jgi:hypothetical protein
MNWTEGLVLGALDPVSRSSTQAAKNASKPYGVDLLTLSGLRFKIVLRCFGTT